MHLSIPGDSSSIGSASSGLQNPFRALHQRSVCATSQGMAARASKLKSYSHSTLRPAPALNPDMLLLHSFATSYPRDCDRCTLRPSALPAPRGSGASYCCVARTSRPTAPSTSRSLRRRGGDVDEPVRLPSNPPSPLPRSTSTSATPHTNRARYPALYPA